MCKEGTTLIELVVVMAGFMILVLLGGQFVSTVQRVTARTELGLLALTIRTEQQTALLTGAERVITFKKDMSGYATHTSTHTFQKGIVFGAPLGALGSPSDPRKLIKKPVTFIDNTLVCYPQGTIQAGTIYLADPRHNQYYALTSGVARYSFLRLYQYRLNWVSL